MTLFIQRVPAREHPEGRRRVVAGVARDGILVIRADRCLFSGGRDRRADDALMAEIAAAMREVPGEEAVRRAGREAWHHRQQGGAQ